MARLCVLMALKGHIQLLAKILQPAKCIDKEGNVAWKLAIGQVCPLYKQKVRKSNDDDQSSLHRLSALYLCKKSTIRRHGRNLLREIEMGSYNQKLNFCIQDGRCQPQ